MDNSGACCQVCGGGTLRRFSPRSALVYKICEECGHCAIECEHSSIAAFEKAQEHYFGETSVLLRSEPSIVEQEAACRKVALIKKRVNHNGTVIEVGPGGGLVATMLQQCGHKVTVCEHSQVLAERLKEKKGLEILIGEFESIDLSNRNFDFFCSFHVIEHVSDPIKHLKAGLEAVKVGGLGFVATPNSRSWEQRVFPTLSPNFDEAHLSVFSEDSLQLTCRQAGWSVIDSITPEYSSDWLRILTKMLRRANYDDESATAGRYSELANSRLRWIYRLLSTVSWPARTVQSKLHGGNEVFVVLSKTI